MSVAYRCEHLLRPDGSVDADAVVEVADGRIARVAPWGELPSRPHTEVERLPGLVLPGAANAHSHVFHRALRGRTHDHGGTFWTWRERMYELAARLDPDRLHRLALATFAEMGAAGFTSVGEFHYLHHGPDGATYADPNELGQAVVDAAREAGLRIALLDTCYLAGGPGRPLEGIQRRFADTDAEGWADRVEALHDDVGDDRVVVGAAAHSVRAVPPGSLEVVAAWAQAHAAPLHVHVSEQPAENRACLEAHGCTPTALLAGAGALGRRTTAVHATHLDAADVDLLGSSGTRVCLCPTTERDLGDGIGPATDLHEAGVELTLGSDSHAVIDPFEEARATELDERLASLARGRLPVAALLGALTRQGQASLGFDDAGRLEVGARADLVAVRLDSPRTAGVPPTAAGVLFAAGAADVTDVVVDGRRVVRGGVHRLGDVGRLLGEAIEGAWT